MGYWWFWLAIVILAIVVEVFTDQLVSIWFIPGALIALIFDICSIGLPWQFLVCLVVSVLGIIFGKKYLLKFKDTDAAKTNIDAIIGEKCIVTESIDNFAGRGQVKVKGQIWSARSVSEDITFTEGEILFVVAIEGVKLIVKK